MSTARLAPTAIYLLTLVAACQVEGESDDDLAPRSERAIEPSAGSTEDPTDSLHDWDPTGAAEQADEAWPSGGTQSGILNVECFGTGPSGVYLGKAAEFAILAKKEIAMIPNTAVIGNLGISPAGGALISGFALSMDNAKEYATSMDVVGNIYAADYNPPTPAYLEAAVADMELAYIDAAARWPDMTGLGVGDIGGMTLPPGVYNWDADLSIPTNVSLHGCARDTWIFQIAGGLSMSNKASVQLTGGAQGRNVVWQVGGVAKIGPAAHLEGTVVVKGPVTLAMGASIHGRLLALSSISLESSTVVAPE